MSERYFYPIRITTKEIGTGYIGRFIDLDIAVDGNSLEETLDNAKEALGNSFANKSFPRRTAKELSLIDLPPGEGLFIVEFDRIAYEKKHDNKTINKVVTMPSWMATIAKERKINCSQLLQRALLKAFEEDSTETNKMRD